MLKRSILKTGFIAIVSLFLANDLFAQDPLFTQFYANPLYLNPAFAGTAHCPRVSLNYRNQWPGISGSFVTTSASYDQHVDALSGGLGLLVWNDRAGEGTLNTTNVSGMYSYQIPITRRFSIKAGLQATWAQKKVDWSKLTFGDMIDARRGFIYNTNEIQRDEPANYVDFSVGVLGFSEKYFVGFAVNHLAEPDESVIEGTSPLPRKYTLHGGAVIPIESKGEPASLSPNIIIQLQQNFLQINFGMYFSKGPIIGGLWYRHAGSNTDAFTALVGFQAGIMKFGYSYDITISKLTNTTAGAHEFSVGLNFDCKPKKRRFRTISCPSF
ncbi:MAG: type IX secretion system membrane protein PorP/SprF [Flavobacteriales bacterium]|nr:type IX secretion system membrane protein PorP/SprF [Flavobacteriales bacterium]